MTDRELEQRLADVVERAAPDDLDAILSRCGAQNGSVMELEAIKQSRSIIDVEAVEVKPKKRWGRWLAAACAALALLGGGGGLIYQNSYAVASVVSLDVNPSIELKVNRNEKVLSCAALNEEAAAVLFSMDGGADLKGTKLEVAVNAIVGALVREGYLSSISSAILISVEDNDQARAQRLQQELVASVDGMLQTQAPGTSVLSQVLTMDAKDDPTPEYMFYNSGLSAGKSALVHKVMEMNGTLALNSTDAFDKLAALSVEELNDLLKTGEKRIPIGKSAAAMAVGVYSGTAALSSVTIDVDPELDKGVYEVKLRASFGEFEYKVDAFTGEILSGQKDILNFGGTGSQDSGSASQSADGSGSQNAGSGVITETQAFNAAAEHLSAQYPALRGYNILNHKVEADRDKGIYEVEFYCGGYEFEYEIDARTGKALRWITDYGAAPAAPPDPPPQTKPASTDIASIEEARKAALAHAGLTESQITMVKAEWDEDDCEYEFRFWCGNSEYAYTIHGRTCAVLEHEVDHHQENSHHYSSGHHSDFHH